MLSSILLTCRYMETWIRHSFILKIFQWLTIREKKEKHFVHKSKPSNSSRCSMCPVALGTLTHRLLEEQSDHLERVSWSPGPSWRIQWSPGWPSWVPGRTRASAVRWPCSGTAVPWRYPGPDISGTTRVCARWRTGTSWRARPILLSSAFRWLPQDLKKRNWRVNFQIFDWSNSYYSRYHLDPSAFTRDCICT